MTADPPDGGRAPDPPDGGGAAEPRPSGPAADQRAAEPGGTRILTSSRDPDVVRRRLQAWLDRTAPGVTVGTLDAPEGNGASSDTVLVQVQRPAEVGDLPDRWALRLAPEPGGMPQFARYDMEAQADVLRLVAARSTAPVPRVLWVEPDPTPLGAPFLVMAAVDGRVPPDVMPYPFGSWLSEASAGDQRRLQDAAIDTLAAIHATELTEDERSRIGAATPGPTALRRHLAATGDYYRWVSADGVRSPLLERALAWLDEHCPEDASAVLSWGDARIGNMMFDGWEPVAVLDWEMAGTGPPEMDLGWMVFCHWWFQDMAVAFGLPGMPGFLRPEDAATRYEQASGRAPRHLGYHLLYAALRLGIVMSRMARRQVAIGELDMPDDPDDTIMHRSAIEQMLAGTYWPRP